MKNLFFIIFFLFFFTEATNAQKNTSITNLQQLLDNKEFVFVATELTPARGGSKNLTSLYDVSIKKDSIRSNLPYFGVSRSAPVTTDDAGINITSTNFECLVSGKEKDSWAVRIKFNDQKEVREFNFLIFDDGNATLDVSGNNRDPIFFRGYIK